ncbi:MAG: hypothetical protein COZ31_10935 [Nitrospirae bacterium CG_4_10_14_3_um_filter_44_29]|nr:DUF86 domain-containing protein [Nitrospirota bacterium]PIP69507.1 MAG: hypothetical protein COW90_10275 [Nitrospirae bacterium CG22_combo_CG10-13_8_21_14_all_44_11]PIV41374.1 MAG: hypothetical protein COS28_05345 [Nitrospirae bacterium CG02_land_8_20_14_3_00_44_33]PIV65516.1 MAG: hypothetical protein COS10_11060 [Nitrospirae bacterium CG01_land_8_20_14_3_00_44_22]PIW89601.1 MAG: hypothetical protein COZ93_04205 [Nitrospirae bacterium CG_4_8_14_3_um_filter_44_28]PIX87347.1 MAG: hypothetical
MVIANLNTARVLELLRFIEACLKELKPFSTVSVGEFLRDKKNPPFVESYLRRALEAVFDIGRHILAKTYGFKEIEYKVIAKELGERGIISRELSDTLYVMAGYRNRMVHFYREITPEELYSIAINNLKDFETFTKEIAVFVKSYEGKRVKK